jgi:hypothetical protein
MPTFEVALKDKSTGATLRHIAAGETEAQVAEAVDTSRFVVLAVKPQAKPKPAPPAAVPPADEMVLLLRSIDARLKDSRRTRSLSVAFGVFVALLGFSTVGFFLVFMFWGFIRGLVLSL